MPRSWSVGQCPNGTFSWGLVRAAPTQFDPDLKNVRVSGTVANVRDNRGGLHTVSVDARWTGFHGRHRTRWHPARVRT